MQIFSKDASYYLFHFKNHLNNTLFELFSLSNLRQENILKKYFFKSGILLFNFSLQFYILIVYFIFIPHGPNSKCIQCKVMHSW